MELVIQPGGRVLSAQPGANLLETLRAEGVPISHSCMSGRCGTCRCRVVSGEVLESGREIRRTSPRADADGHYVLACMSALTGPCVIEVPEPDEIVMHPARVLKAKVESLEPLTHDILRVRLRSPKPLDFSPGQYATLQFTPEHIRPYSMAGIADDELLEFHVRLVPGGRVSGYVRDTLRPGDAVRVSGPLGTAYLRSRHEGPMLCVAGGTGLAPVISLVRGALAAGMTNDIHVYAGARSTKDVYGLDGLRALAADYPNLRVHSIVASGAAPPARPGLVTDAIATDWTSLSGWRAYLCGSPAMVDAAALVAARLGASSTHIHADAFYDAA